MPDVVVTAILWSAIVSADYAVGKNGDVWTIVAVANCFRSTDNVVLAAPSDVQHIKAIV